MNAGAFRRLTAATALGGIAAGAFAAYAVARGWWPWPGSGSALALILAIAGAELFRVRLPNSGSFSIGSALALYALWFRGPVAVIAAELGGFALAGLVERRPVRVVMFNMGQGALSALAGWAGLALFGWQGPEAVQPLAWCASWFAFHVTNTALVSAALAARQEQDYPDVLVPAVRAAWRQQVLAGVAAAALTLSQPWPDWAGTIAGIGLLALYHYGTRLMTQGSQRESVQRLLVWPTLADPFSRDHSERVVRYAMMIVRELPVGPEEAQAIRYGALFHDIGVSPALSQRLGEVVELSADDRRQVIGHPAAGARVVGRVHELRDVARIVRHHHERYDGLGYPEGLKGDQIPLGARVVAIAEAFDSMTSRRPYRRAMTIAQAASELRREAEAQFDPLLVEAFLRALDRTDLGQPAADPEQTVVQLREWIGGPERAWMEAPPSPGWLGRLTRLAGGAPWPVTVGLSALTRLGQSLNASLSPETTILQVTEMAGRLFAGPCFLALVAPGGEGLTVRAQFGFQPSHRLIGMDAWSLGRRVIQQGAPVSSQNIARDFPELTSELFALLRRERVRSLIGVPLVARGKPVGALLVFAREMRTWGPDEMTLLLAVSAQGALAIENARLFDEVSERYRALSNMKAFNDALIEDLNAGVLVVDPAGRLKLANRTVRQMCERLGVELLEPLEGVPYRDLAEELGIDESPLLKALQTRERQESHDVRLQGPKGTVYVSIAASPLVEASGNPVGAVAVLHDRTQAKRLEEQVRQNEKLAAVGELAAGAAHEIRNPLTSVRGFIQLLHRRPGTADDDRGLLEIMLGEIDRIDSIIRDLLLMAKPAKAKLERVDLHALLHEVLVLTQSKEAARNVSIHRRFAADPAVLDVDERQFKQVLLNIVQNALEAMSDGGELTVSSEFVSISGTAPTNWVKVQIRDTGTGIPPDVLARIFDPFYTTKEYGTGLGLAVSFQIVQAHGGRIEVESQPGKGTTFSILLPNPVAAAQASVVTAGRLSAAAASAASRPAERPRGRGRGGPRAKQ